MNEEIKIGIYGTQFVNKYDYSTRRWKGHFLDRMKNFFLENKIFFFFDRWEWNGSGKKVDCEYFIKNKERSAFFDEINSIYVLKSEK